MVLRPATSAPDPAHDRLAGLRAPRPDAAASKKSPVRIELLVGMVLVAGGVLVALSMGRGDSVPTAEEAVVAALTAPAAEETSTGESLLLADETDVALALELGQFPPDLEPGDTVLVTVVPDFDTGGEVRSLESTPTVVGVSAPDDMTGRWVVTLRANKSVPKVLAGAKSVLLSVIGGAE